MYGELVVMIRDEADAEAASRLADAVLATWTDDTVPEIQAITPNELDASVSESDAIWLFAGSDSPLDLYAVLEKLEHDQVPTLLSRVGDRQSLGSILQDGVIIGPPESDATGLRLVLQSLMSQSGAIYQLRQDLHVSQKSQIGLSSQVGKLDEEMQLAAKMQKLFLPKQLPEPEGVKFNVLFQPAGYVSGDIYDIVQIDKEHISFYIADAVGHGASAALMTMFIKQSLQLKEYTERGQVVVMPDEAIRRVNMDIVRRQLETFRFATVCCGTYHLPSRRLMLAHAGHPPPFLFRKDGSVETINLEGPLLGIFEDEPFELTTMTLEPGDRLLMYSDGFEVAFGNPDQPMNAEYVRELHAMQVGKPEAAIAELKTKLDQATGSLNQLDDLTVVLMDVL